MNGAYEAHISVPYQAAMPLSRAASLLLSRFSEPMLRYNLDDDLKSTIWES